MDGTLVLEDGQMLHLWGLALVDVPAVRAFLVGRHLGCVIVLETKDRTEADCSAQGQVAEARMARLDLYLWLVELGWAVRHCDVEAHPKDARGDPQTIEFSTHPYKYICRDGGEPIRAFPIR